MDLRKGITFPPKSTGKLSFSFFKWATEKDYSQIPFKLIRNKTEQTNILLDSEGTPERHDHKTYDKLVFLWQEIYSI